MARTVQDVFDLWSQDAVPVEQVSDLASQEEIEKIAAGCPDVLREKLEWAFWRLSCVLRRKPEIPKDWKQLVLLYRNQTSPVNDAGVFVFPDGEAVEIPILVERSAFRYDEIFHDVAALSDALDALENFNPELYKSEKVRRSINSDNGKKSKRSTALDYEKIDSVLNALYRAKGVDGAKKAAVSDVISWFHVRWQKEFEGLKLPSDSSIRNRIKEKFTK